MGLLSCKWSIVGRNIVMRHTIVIQSPVLWRECTLRVSKNKVLKC